MKKGDRVMTSLLEAGTVVEYLGEFDFPKVKVLLDGAKEPAILYAGSLRMAEPEKELERILVLAEYSESFDAILLAAEVRRLRARLEAVRKVVEDSSPFGEDVPASKVLEAVRGS